MTNERAVPEYLTIRQTAERAGYPERMIRRWVAEGIIPTRKSGNRHYINWEMFTADMWAYKGASGE
jgi:hypothetical protein